MWNSDPVLKEDSEEPQSCTVFKAPARIQNKGWNHNPNQRHSAHQSSLRGVQRIKYTRQWLCVLFVIQKILIFPKISWKDLWFLRSAFRNFLMKLYRGNFVHVQIVYFIVTLKPEACWSTLLGFKITFPKNLPAPLKHQEVELPIRYYRDTILSQYCNKLSIIKLNTAIFSNFNPFQLQSIS